MRRSNDGSSHVAGTSCTLEGVSYHLQPANHPLASFICDKQTHKNGIQTAALLQASLLKLLVLIYVS